MSRGKNYRKVGKKKKKKKNHIKHNRDIQNAEKQYNSLEVKSILKKDYSATLNNHHTTPVSRGGDEKIRIPVCFHKGIHEVFGNLKLDEYVIFIELLVERMKWIEDLPMYEIEKLRKEAMKLAHDMK